MPSVIIIIGHLKLLGLMLRSFIPQLPSFRQWSASGGVNCFPLQSRSSFSQVKHVNARICCLQCGFSVCLLTMISLLPSYGGIGSGKQNTVKRWGSGRWFWVKWARNEYKQMARLLIRFITEFNVVRAFSRYWTKTVQGYWLYSNPSIILFFTFWAVMIRGLFCTKCTISSTIATGDNTTKYLKTEPEQ